MNSSRDLSTIGVALLVATGKLASMWPSSEATSPCHALNRITYPCRMRKPFGVEVIVNMSMISARSDATSVAARQQWLSERVFDWSGVPAVHQHQALPSH